MKASDKAKKLVEKFLRIEDDTTFYWEPYYDKPYNDDEVLPHAKKCALFCVENEYFGKRELLINLKSCGIGISEKAYLYRIQELIDEEAEVKQEIVNITL